MHDLDDLIAKCKAQNSDAQRKVYEHFSPVMLAICIRYMKDRSKAEDVMQEGFIKIFTKIDQFSGKGSFEGWMKRIMVNTSLHSLRKSSKTQRDYDFDEIQESTIKNIHENESQEVFIDDPKSLINAVDFSKEEILESVTELPTGFRTVFNLYAIEGLKHKDIAKELNISTGTSKSQLMRARKRLQDILYEKAKIKYKTNNNKTIFN